jgi:hypothetical protein
MGVFFGVLLLPSPKFSPLFEPADWPLKASFDALYFGKFASKIAILARTIDDFE